MAPVVWWLETTGAHAAAFSVFTLAMATDLVDGRLAARLGSNRALGRILDPASDKLLAICAWLALWSTGRAAPWMVGAFVGRDLVFGLVWWRLARRGVRLSSNRWGQVATSFEGTAIGLLLWPWPTFDVHWPTVGTVVGLSAWACILLSLPAYLRSTDGQRTGYPAA